MEMSERINELADALSKAQGELANVHKDKSGYGYKYADLAAVLDVARPVLSKHGLAIVQSAGNAGDQVSVTTTLVHASGQWMRDTITMPVEIPHGKNGKPSVSRAQAVGMVITYARRYSLAAFVGIAQEDNDAAVQQPAPQQQKPSYTMQQAQQNMPGWKEKGLSADSMVNKIKTKYTMPADVEAYIRQELGAAAA